MTHVPDIRGAAELGEDATLRVELFPADLDASIAFYAVLGLP